MTNVLILAANGRIARHVIAGLADDTDLTFEYHPVHHRLSTRIDKECETAMEDIRQDLAKAHADTLSGGSPQNPVRLTGDQISDFHHDVFSQHYGGQYLIFGGDIPGAWVTGWCTAPGCW